MKRFIARCDQKIDAKVARLLLPLMGGLGPSEIFECEVPPVRVGTTLPILKDSVDRLMVRLGLDQFSSVTINADTGKVAVAIAKKDLRVPLVQANIKAELENAHQQAAQLSL